MATLFGFYLGPEQPAKPGGILKMKDGTELPIVESSFTTKFTEYKGGKEVPSAPIPFDGGPISIASHGQKVSIADWLAKGQAKAKKAAEFWGGKEAGPQNFDGMYGKPSAADYASLVVERRMDGLYSTLTEVEAMIREYEDAIMCPHPDILEHRVACLRKNPTRARTLDAAIALAKLSPR